MTPASYRLRFTSEPAAGRFSKMPKMLQNAQENHGQNLFSADIYTTNLLMTIAIRYESVAMTILNYIPMTFGGNQQSCTTKPAAGWWFESAH